MIYYTRKLTNTIRSKGGIVMSSLEKHELMETKLTAIDLSVDKIDCGKIKLYKSWSKSHGH